MSNLVKLKCIREKSKLRIKIVSPGYSALANCRFPRDIREEGQEYYVPANDITVVNMRGSFFYSISKHNIQYDDKVHKNNQYKDSYKISVYGDIENEIPECNICLDAKNELMIIVPCGHYCACNICVYKLSKCPICRGGISNIITKSQLE